MLDIRYWTILRVALPMMLSGFIQSVISITDAAFLSRYSELAYDASGSAGLWYITLGMVFIGLSDGSQIAMAQKVGEKNKEGFAAVFHSNIVILIGFACLLTLLVQLVMPYWLNSLVTSSELAQAQFDFLEIRSYSFWAIVITLSIQAVYLATGKTTLVMYTSLIVAVSNIVLDYLWIFGIGSFPEMGLKGAAWASTTAEYLGMIFLLATLLFGQIKRDFPLLGKLKASSKQIVQNLKIGTPLLLQGMVALSIWAIFFTWIEQMGGENLTISLNIRYVYFLAFIPIWGFASATKSYIAQYHGANEMDKIPIIQKRILILSFSFLIVTFHGSFLYPELLIRLVSEKINHIQESASILRYVSASIFIYAIGSVYFQTLSGLSKTRITFYVECICTSFYVGSAYLFIKVLNWEIKYVWTVEYIYFISIGVLSYLYLKFIYKNQHT